MGGSDGAETPAHAALAVDHLPAGASFHPGPETQVTDAFDLADASGVVHGRGSEERAGYSRRSGGNWSRGEPEPRRGPESDQPAQHGIPQYSSPTPISQAPPTQKAHPGGRRAGDPQPSTRNLAGSCHRMPPQVPMGRIVSRSGAAGPLLDEFSSRSGASLSPAPGRLQNPSSRNQASATAAMHPSVGGSGGASPAADGFSQSAGGP